MTASCVNAEMKRFAGGETTVLKQQYEKKFLELEQHEKKVLQKETEDLRHKPDGAQKLKEDYLQKLSVLESQGYANPTVYSVITFPFLFAVMFGDWGVEFVCFIMWEKKLSSQVKMNFSCVPMAAFTHKAILVPSFIFVSSNCRHVR